MNNIYIMVEFPNGNTYEVTAFDEVSLTFNTDDLAYPFYNLDDFNDEEYKFSISVSSNWKMSDNVKVSLEFIKWLLKGI